MEWHMLQKKGVNRSDLIIHGSGVGGGGGGNFAMQSNKPHFLLRKSVSYYLFFVFQAQQTRGI